MLAKACMALVLQAPRGGRQMRRTLMASLTQKWRRLCQYPERAGPHLELVHQLPARLRHQDRLQCRGKVISTSHQHRMGVVRTGCCCCCCGRGALWVEQLCTGADEAALACAADTTHQDVDGCGDGAHGDLGLEGGCRCRPLTDMGMHLGLDGGIHPC